MRLAQHTARPRQVEAGAHYRTFVAKIPCDF